MKNKLNLLFLTLAFLTAITLPLAFSDKAGGKVSEQEKRTLATFPTLFTENGSLSRTFRAGLEHWIDDNVGFRAQAKSLQANIDYQVFNVSPSQQVVVGADGWFFYAGENNLNFSLNPNPFTADELAKIKETQQAIQASLAKRGIQYVIVLIPSKESVYPEFMGGGFKAHATAVDILGAYLEKNTSIPVINLKPALLEAKKDEQVYFKNDTHWNGLGSYIGYTTIVNDLNDLGILTSAAAPVTTAPGTHIGDLAIMMGGKDFLPPEPYLAINKITDNAVEQKSGDEYERLKAVVDPQVVTSFSIFQNNLAENEKLLIIGDSFFASLKLPWLLGENFSQVGFVWTRYLKNDYITATNPDVVMLEITERYTKTVASYLDPAMVGSK